MKSIKHIFGIGILLITFLFSNQTFGQKRKNSTSGNIRKERNFDNNRVHSTHRTNDRYRTQPVRRSPHYRYPRHHRVIRTLPRNYVTITYRGLPYFYSSGIYYTLYADEYVVVLPPNGFRIVVLPVGHIRIVKGPTVYFYHSGIYYIETEISTDSEEKYEVVTPNIGMEISTLPNDAEAIIIDGNQLYEFNDVLYKEKVNSKGVITYEVVYNKS